MTTSAPTPVIETWNGVAVEHRLSPNARMRPTKEPVSALVLHADASRSADTTLSWVDSPVSQVSYHLLIGRTGRAFLVVPVEQVAWACGVSEFPQATVVSKTGVPGINTRSLSMCFSNANDGIEPYTDDQCATGAKLAAYLITRFPVISLARITTHAVVARPVGRKTDPKGFDLDRFKQRVRAELEALSMTCP
jgi:N-acetyl-anhydromuramyl-L-alanine amidase AmpD